MLDHDRAYIAAARLILPQFGLPADTELALLASGHNYVFRVDHETERFVLRFQSDDRLSDAAQLLQLKWLKSIRSAAGIAVPDPILTLKGEWFVRTAVNGGGTTRCVLLGWVEGEPLSPPEAFTTRDILERVGEVVARLHQCSSSYPSGANELDAERLVGRGSCIGDGSAQRFVAADDYASLAAAASRIAAAMERLGELDGQYGLIHADLAPANWVFHQGEPRPIDFDEFGRGFFLFDLLGVLWSHVSWDEYPEFRRHLLSGYERVRPLLPEAARLADCFQAATLFAWLNHGCRLKDETARTEFLKWVPSTARTVARLCRV